MNASTREPGSGFMLSIATLTAIVATLLVNALSNLFPPKGLNIGAIANTVLQGVLITPASYAFAIWGLIYVGLLAYGIYQLRPAQRRNPTMQRVNWLLISACIAQMVWVYLFTLRLFGLSIVAMVGILLSLMGAYLQLNVGKVRVSREHQRFAHIPFSIYLGWISVATVVNVASALYSAQWQGWGISATAWTVTMLLVGAAIAAIVAMQRADVAFTLVFIWAYVAIAVRQFANPALWMTAIALAIVLAVVLVLSRAKRKPLQAIKP